MTEPLVLGGAGLVALATILVIAAARRAETRKVIGALSRETRARDADRRDAMTAGGERLKPTGRQVEVSAKRAQSIAVAPPPGPPTEWRPPDPDALGATRRQFLNRSIVGFFAIGLSGFGAAVIAFLWPKLGGGFGSVIRVGNVSEIVQDIRDNNGFLYKPEGRMWITEYPASALEKARVAYTPGELAGMEAGLVALYQKCPHLGCRVPSCSTSQWFECQCHGSQYNRVGEKKGGPAPRGMDRFTMTVSDGVLSVDTGAIILGPPIGTNTTGQEAEGPHCAGAAEH